MPSAKFLLVLHAFIYIHFPVHCEPSTPAEEKNLSKLPSQTLSQTIFHRVFQLSSQTALVRFHRQKRVHTRLCSKDRTQRPTRRNRGRSGRDYLDFLSKRPQGTTKILGTSAFAGTQTPTVLKFPSKGATTDCVKTPVNCPHCGQK